mgnify:CR=1 FL=1
MSSRKPTRRAFLKTVVITAGAKKLVLLQVTAHIDELVMQRFLHPDDIRVELSYQLGDLVFSPAPLVWAIPGIIVADVIGHHFNGLGMDGKRQENNGKEDEFVHN